MQPDLKGIIPVGNDFPAANGGKHWDLLAEREYQNWRELKLENAYRAQKLNRVNIKHLNNPSDKECAALLELCQMTNIALYSTNINRNDPEKTHDDLRLFTSRLALTIAERHRSADDSGIVALTVSSKKRQRGYIPYSDKAMNWHTDGYYNSRRDQIRSMVLHCVRPAKSGGRNQFFDPEIAYIRLRDENPDYIAAFMHPEAMTIPENREDDGSLRAVSIGPVFSISASGHLAMRYTARSRSIAWRNDPATREATAFLQNLLASGDALIQTTQLEAGHGILCNNVLHNRTGFAGDVGADHGRLLYRIRFHNRLGES